MIGGVATLLCFQLAGELSVRLAHLPMSGPLCGMLALLIWLHLRGQISQDLGKVCDGILAHMALLFVPVGVGAMRYSELFISRWHVIALAILLGACVTLLTTAFAARTLVAWTSHPALEVRDRGARPMG